jgi:hypothetical protein
MEKEKWNITCVTDKSWLLFRKRTIPTGLPPHVDEVSVKFWVEGVAWSAQQIHAAVNLVYLNWIRYFFIRVTLRLS